MAIIITIRNTVLLRCVSPVGTLCDQAVERIRKHIGEGKIKALYSH
jgi:hypothetical protein